MRALGLAATSLVLALAACPAEVPPPPPMPPVATGYMRVRVFTEPAPVRVATTIGKYTFVATDNELARWDDHDTVTNPVPGTRFVALAPEPARNQLWILTDGGLGRYDLKTETYTALVAPPPTFNLDYATLAKDGASIQPAGDGGVWLGTPRGLYYATAAGGWVATPITDAIRGLARDDAGYLWIAARGGLVARKPTGETVRLTPAEGFAITDPRLVVPLAGNHVIVIGNDDQNRERLAIGKQLNWVTYRALPQLHLGAAVARDGAAVVMAGERLYRISTDPRQEHPLERDAVRLVALVGNPVEDWTIEPMPLALPSGTTMLAAAGDQLLVGTRDMGVARYVGADTQPTRWLRRMQMFASAQTLTVACARPDDCWVATGVRQAWHWVGDRFVPGGPDETVLAVARDPNGAIYALHRGASEIEIRVSKIEGTTWVPLPKLSLSTPGDQPEIAFARFTAANALWVGLRYREGLDTRPFGAAIVDPIDQRVTYDKLAPVGVVDAAAARGNVMWFATSEGVARVERDTVKLWTEADGLRSELARALAIDSRNNVVVATGDGAALYDGKAWSFPPALRFPINDVVATRNGQLWMATERGIAAWDGKKVRRLDTRRGLAENQVLDVATDQFDRVWARGPSSLTLVAQ